MSQLPTHSSHMSSICYSIGPNRAKFQVCPESDSHVSDEPIDKIEEYWSNHYLSATEAVWRILSVIILTLTWLFYLFFKLSP